MDFLILSFVIAAFLLVYAAVECFKRNGDVRVSCAKTMVVLGSGLVAYMLLYVGGHTSEMITLIKGLSDDHYNPMVFVCADTDKKSMEHVEASNLPFAYSTRIIPRSREVGQSYISSVLSTVKAMLNCLVMVCKENPSLLLVNGPGTCVPVVFSVVLFRILNVMQCKIVYVESFCRVEKLSLTGYLLYFVADSFIVQWPQLQKKYKRSVYLGNLM